MFSAAIRSGFIQMRMAKVRPPRMSAFWTPPTAVKSRLDQAHEIIGHLVRLKDVRSETQVGRGKLRIGGLNRDDRDLRFGRQIVPDGVDSSS